LYNPCNFDYFKQPERIGETQNIEKELRSAFQKIYVEHKTDKILDYNNYESQEFFTKVMEYCNNPRQLDQEKSKCTEVFAEYLYSVAKVSNSETFEKIVIFITLFRECLNGMNKKEGSQNVIYTEENNAEDAPDISNEFVTEYLENEQVYGFQKEEVIDITQNFCQWLYDHNYTCSKLSLISSL
jgi:formyltetrahydrofolate hydrolase